MGITVPRLIAVPLLLIGIVAAIAIQAFPVHAAELVQGNVQGWTNPYTEPLQDEAECERNEAAASKCALELANHSSSYLQGLVRKIAERNGFSQRKLFEEAESRWQGFRDASCRFESAYASHHKAETAASCIHAYNRGRIETLSVYDYCLGGGQCSSDFSLYLISSWTKK